MERFNIIDCFVCILKYVLKKKICIFGLFIKYLYNVFEVLCIEFEKRKGGSFGINFNFIRNFVMLNKVFFDESSYVGIILFFLILLNLIDY